VNIFNKPRNSEYAQEPRESNKLGRNADPKTKFKEDRQAMESQLDSESQSSYSEESPVA